MNRYTCRLCNRLVLSQSVTFDGTSLVVNLPEGSYNDGCRYCVVVAQSIPTTVTINAPVVFTIGAGTVQYPVTRCDCSPATACNIHTRTRYAVRVETSATSGVFRLLGRSCCGCDNNLQSINGTAPTAGGVTG